MINMFDIILPSIPALKTKFFFDFGYTLRSIHGKTFAISGCSSGTDFMIVNSVAGNYKRPPFVCSSV